MNTLRAERIYMFGLDIIKVRIRILVYIHKLSYIIKEKWPREYLEKPEG